MRPTSRTTPFAAAIAVLGVLLLLPLAGAQLAGAAAVHVDNPFVGATGYVNQAWRTNALNEANAVQGSNPTLATNMRAIASTPSAVWMDRRAAVTGADGGIGLVGHLDAALAQQQGTTPETVIIVVYDLPGRDCNALASNGELPATAAGLATYKTEYIDPIAEIFARTKYEGLRIVAIIEPDSLPNITTNSGVQACQQAAPFYEQGVAYALDKLHAIPQVYTYVDAAHAGWLGWPNNASGAVTEFAKVANMTVAKQASIDGFITDTANTTPLREPFFTGQTTVNGQQVMSGAYYEFNPSVDEAAFTADMYTRLTRDGGFSPSIGMLVDTSRNGWGGCGGGGGGAGNCRPTAASTSTDLNTFINQSRVDRRPHRGAWCNQNGAGIGERPAATPSGFPASHLDAFVWVKPPGESDGASSDIPNDEGKRFDRMCDPTFNAPALKGALTNALPNAPLSGHWFPEQFRQLVTNAFPAIGSPPPDTTPPSAPTGLASPSKTSTSVSLSWTASTDNVGVTGYQVLRNGIQVGTSSTTSFSDTGLTASTTYSYTVRALDAAGNVSALSAALSVTTNPATGDTTPPTAPANLAAPTVTSTSVGLTWSASTDNVGVAGYDVLRAPGASGGTFAVVGTSTTTSFTNSGLTASTTFRYQVRARDAAGNLSAVSNTIQVTTSPAATDTTPPTAPTNLTSPSHTSSSVSLAWTASTDNVGVTGYRVFRGATQVGTPTATSFTDTGLAASTTFSYTVRAVDAAGNVSNPSAALSVTTDAAPAGGCTAAYRIVNQWPDGFQAEVTVTNGAVASTGWTVAWTFANGQAITQLWNGTDTVSGAGHSVRNLDYNGNLGPSASTSFGFTATWNRVTNAVPAVTCARR